MPSFATQTSSSPPHVHTPIPGSNPPYYTRQDEADALADFQARAYTRAQQEYDRRIDAAKEEADMKDELEPVLLHANDEELLRFLGINRGEVLRYIEELKRDLGKQAQSRGGISMIDGLESPRKEVNVLRGRLTRISMTANKLTYVMRNRPPLTFRFDINVEFLLRALATCCNLYTCNSKSLQ
jgi:hypothetical protein